MKVAVCVLTYRRPEGLARLLRGLDSLRFEASDPPGLELIVVDNDPEGSARELCAETGPEISWPIRYVVEPRRGIACARNRAVAEALAGGAELVAFIDDDEVPEPAWLEELLRVQRAYSADVVSGPVEPHFITAPPRWITESGVFDSDHFETGAAIDHAGTGNVLVRAEVFQAMKPAFDERLALTGGEDSDFFRRVYRAGYRMVWSDAAVAHEWIPESRLTPAWIFRRAFRVGLTFGSHRRGPSPSAGGRFSAVTSGLRRTAVGAVRLPLSLLRGRPASIRALHDLCFRAGTLAGALGLRYEEYRTTHGR